MSNKIEVTYRDVAELIPYINNARTHSDEQIAQVASSIKEFGFTNPILIDNDSGIIAGHGRLLASRLLQLEKVPTISLKGLTDAQKKAYIIADNKLALNSGWDEDLLKLELESLHDMNFNIDLLGFSLDELDSLASFTTEKVEEDLFEDSDKEQNEAIKLSVVCMSETDKQILKEELLSRGYEC